MNFLAAIGIFVAGQATGAFLVILGVAIARTKNDLKK
jgi:hypothetical protein